jgi:uncharacterized SAM-binding protein YcdF (DUF218 family)
VPTDETQIFQFIELDYQAKNTIENVIYTLHHLRTSKEHQNVLVISSDYHILRMNWLMYSLKQKKDKFEVSYLGMKTDYSRWGSLKILLRETVKVIKTAVFLSIWDREYTNASPQLK